MKQFLPKNIVILIISGVLSTGIYLVDQSFLGHLGAYYLKIQVIITLLPIIILTIGKVLGHSMLVVLPKERRFYGQSFTLFLIAAGFVSLLLALFLKIFLGSYNIYTNEIFNYALVINMSAIVQFLCIFFNFNFLIIQKIDKVLNASILTFTLNLLGNFCSYFFLPAEMKLMGYAYSTLASTVVGFLFQFFSTVNHEKIILEKPIEYMKRIKHIVFGDSFSTLILLLTPTLISYILLYSQYDQFIIYFNVGTSVLHFTAMPAFTLIGYCTGIVAGKANDPDEFKQAIMEVKKQVFKFGIIPGTIAVLVFSIFSESIWKLPFIYGGLFLLLSNLRYLPLCWNITDTVILKVKEQQLNLSKIDLWSNILMIVLVFLLSFSKLLNIYSFSLLIVAGPMVKYIMTKRLVLSKNYLS